MLLKSGRRKACWYFENVLIINNNCVMEGDKGWVVVEVAESMSATAINCNSNNMPWPSGFNVRTRLLRETYDLDRVGSPCILTLSSSEINCKQRFP